MTSLRAAAMLAGAALLLGLAAFAVPLWAFPDAPGLDRLTARYARTETRHWSSIPPLRLQLSEVTAPPALLQGLPAATFTWRTIFGVPYGTTRLADGQSHTAWHRRPALLAWSSFALAEVALLAAAARLAWASS